jgi:arylsulfatase A-like enzyme/Tfp pilus assembly protein PilF
VINFNQLPVASFQLPVSSSQFSDGFWKPATGNWELTTSSRHRVSSDDTIFQMKRWVVALALLLIIAAAAVWFVRTRPITTRTGVDLGTLPPGVSRDHLNLVIVTLDTTRADRIGAYGSREVETPTIDQLAAEGVLFEQAVSVAPLTLPAHSSIFTGKFPPEHGVRDNGGFFLGPEQVTLAEMLKGRGYRTGGFVAAYVLAGKWGINQGFDTYFDDFDLSGVRAVSLSAIQRPANEVLDKALPWIEQSNSAPFFAWIHLYDPHSPYRPPEPFATKYKGHPYNGEIAFADSQIARLVSTLKSRGLYDRTVIVVMGDHGESLGDHGESAHGFFVYNSVTHVPLVMHAPFSRIGHRRIADPVRSIDIMPTMLDLLGAPAASGISGVSLVPLLTGAKNELGLDAYSEAMYPLHHYGWSDLHALRSGRYKVIDAPRPELYDVDRDPSETSNLFTERQALGDKMIAELRRVEGGFTKAVASMPAADVDPEARERLAALGYVGTFVANASDPRTGRADPKDKIGLFNKLNEVSDMSKDREDDPEGSFNRVIALLTEVIHEDPRVIDAWFMRGTKYLSHGDLDKAVGDFKQTLSLKPDYDLAVSNLAQAYRRMGNDDAALAGFEHYLQLDPKDPFVRYQMGEIWLDRGDLPRAESLFRRALELDPSVVAAKNALGVIALQRGDSVTAERLIREALATKPTLRLAHFNLALVAEQHGDPRTAEREYVEELKQHPENFKAAFNLSRLYEQVGDREGQIDALKQSIVSNPRFAEGHLFLAKAYLDAGTKLDEAVKLAEKGLQLAPKSEYAPLGHYVLADIYNRQGRAREGAEELARGRALEASTKKGTR